MEVEGLVQLADDKVTSTDFVTRGGLPAHRDNHYFEFDSFKQILKLGMTFNIKYKQRLLVNDSSLKQGGLYDISGGWRPSHFNHREGIVVDINNFKERNIKFEKFVEDHNAFAKWEGLDVSTTPHYHIRLLGKGRDE